MSERWEAAMDTKEETSAAAAEGPSSEPLQIPQDAPTLTTTIGSGDIATEASVTETSAELTKGVEITEHVESTEESEVAKGNKEDRRLADDADDAASEVSSALSTEEWGTGTFTGDLLHELDNIQTQGSFASFHALKHVDPELFIQDVGPIIMPLPVHQIRQMIGMAAQAPFGKGSETLVDTTVRNTWELDPKYFKLRSPRWGSDLQKICGVVAHDLGVKLPVNAELYKLLLYEEGAMFKAHTDTEKCPGMFGTLVICLPSTHKGGDVVVKHCSQTKTFKTSAVAQSFACWYSDVHHEVLPVTSGYRVVLTYNLTIDQARQQPSAGLVRNENRALRHTLKRWLRKGADGGEADYVYYGLDHEYTEASISMKALKGRDSAVVQTLQDLASGLDFDVLLALTEMMEAGSTSPNGFDPRFDSYRSNSRRYYNDEDEIESEPDEDPGPHEIEDVLETELSVKLLVDLRGRPIIRDVNLSQEHCLRDEGFFEGATRREEYEGYQGNWGPTATHWYRVTAALIIRRDSIAKFFKDSLSQSPRCSDSNVALPLTYLTDSILKGGSNQKSVFDTLKETWNACLSIPGRDNSLKSDGHLISKILRAACQVEQWDFFESAAGVFQGTLPHEYYKLLHKQVGDGKVPFDMVKTGLASTVIGCKYFWQGYSAIEAFAPIDERPSDEIREWVQKTLVKSLTGAARSASFVGVDGMAVAVSAQKYADLDWLSSTVVPLIEDHFTVPAFALGFLSALLLSIRQKAFPAKVTAKLYKRLAKNFVAKLDFSTIHGDRPEEETQKAARHSYWHTAPAPALTADKYLAVTPDTLADVFHALLILSSPPREDLAMLLAMKLASFAPKMQAADFHPLWIPFLQKLLVILKTTKTPLTTPRYQQIFGAILESYRENYVGQKPSTPASGPSGGMCLRLNCPCHDCRQLEAFLANPATQVCRFPVGKKARHHLHKQIEKQGIQCLHVTGRSGPQDTLVVTKLGPTMNAKYEAKQKRAAEMFQSFDQTKLAILLGEDYPAIAEGLWKRPRSLAARRGCATHTPPAAAVPVISPLGNTPAPRPFESATEPGTKMAANLGGPSQYLPRFDPVLAAAAGPSQSHPTATRAAERAMKRKAEPEIIDLT
ncbi:Putative prolyl 4-hydroxylase alpha subunit, Fe(2+) 2OG dioxygenase domain-containing protein [Colletotrichum destructivum]|uniref:Prolyl 4-hydroxylase alpha subunit, Fe(2+) 2OG dioxygenase domain-containing protein n=1 Tax=Colletotrichum destructivum TaxID=34406 RepID=A0AAX4IKJ5_9PEZI|nr:Putative prolyl 4-hydroxylase alpha subunit, Fe(2+) 2OG dioxygenase domain-containing protein [Colletotrichum destructivum]